MQPSCPAVRGPPTLPDPGPGLLQFLTSLPAPGSPHGCQVRVGQRLQARRRPAQGHRRAGRGVQGRQAVPVPARRHRDRQDDDRRERHRRPQQADPGPRPQQDSRGPALQGVPRVLPQQRRLLLHQLLRLLPAGSLHPPAGHLHREGLVDQRAHRPAAPVGDKQTRFPRRRDRGRLRLLHLRPRVAHRLQADDGPRQEGRDHRPRGPAPQAGGRPVPAERRGLRAGQVPGPRGHHRDLAERRRDRDADRAVRRRGRFPGQHQPDQRGGAQPDGRDVRLPGQALRHPGASACGRPSSASSRS